MKTNIKKLISVILCLVIAGSVFSVAAYAENGKISSCGDDCEFYPTIVVPGLGQSSLMILDDNGEPILDKDGNMVSPFPAYVQTDKIVKRVLLPALLTLTTQRDVGFSDAVADAIYEAFEINACDLHAQTAPNVATERFLHPYSQYTEHEKEMVNMHVPFEKYHTDLPKDHLYYFMYNSFGNHIGLVDELYEFIQMVMEQTGHDKVNLVPLSQGGSIFSGLMEYHPEAADLINKVIFIVPCLDGSKIIGDVFNDRITFLDSDYLYHGFLEEITLLDEYTAHLIEILARILPDEIIMDSLKKGVKRLVSEVMIRSTSMWALCPSDDYESAAEKYLSDPELSDIKAQTYRYYQAQLHCDDNILSFKDKGVQFFCVAEYNYKMINVGESWNKQNADFIIHLDSTSMGATAANCGETLPEGYQQQNTHCSDPSHNHISPDNVVDASTGLLADNTFYFSSQRHDLTQHNNAILKLAFQLIANDDIQDVFSDPAFPQFMAGRDVRDVEEPLEIAKTVDMSKLSEKDARDLDAAVNHIEELLDGTLCEDGEYKQAAEDLTEVLVRTGYMKAEKEKDPTFLAKISNMLYEKFGSNGFSEMPGFAIKNLFRSFSDKLNGIFG